MAPRSITILIPVWNNQDEIHEAYARVRDVVAKLGRPFEILFVDDGSQDASFSVLEELGRTDPRVSAMKLDRNYGQNVALAAGLEHARGDVIVTLDVDLQADPVEIPRFLAKIDEGYDLVSGWRVRRTAPLLSRRLPAALFARLVVMIAGVRLRDFGCGMNAALRDLALQLPAQGERRRFLKPLAATLARRVAEVQIVDRAGTQCASRYDTRRLFALALDFVLAFSHRPLRAAVAGLLGERVLRSRLRQHEPLYTVARLVRGDSPRVGDNTEPPRSAAL